MRKINYIFRMLVISIFLVTFNSCYENDTIEILIEDQLILKDYKPELMNFLDLSSKIITETDNGDIISYKLTNLEGNYLFKDYNNDYSLVYITNDKIIYENFTTKSNIIYGEILHFSFVEDIDYKYKVVNFSKIKSLNKNESAKLDISCEDDFWLDVGLCSISAGAIALSDGPLPFADAIAVTYFSGCLVRAGRSMDRCNGIDPIL